MKTKIKKYIKYIVLLFGFIPYLYDKYRRKISYFDYLKVSKFSCPFIPLKIFQNRLYGLSRVMNNFDGKFDKTSCSFEHGVYFGDDVMWYDLVESVKRIYTYGDRRERIIRASEYPNAKTIEIVKVGPYIRYADNFFNNQKRQELKDKFGKTLLVFPFHSAEKCNVKYDEDQFMNEIKKISIDYDSVIVSLHYLDVHRHNRYARYLDAGYTVVCAGHIQDQYFMDRLRDIIELSDMSMSNGVGSHIGYCLSLGKPHYIFNQKIEIDDKECDLKNVNMDNYNRNVQTNNSLVINAFNIYSPIITEDQLAIVKEFWGDF